MTFKPGTRLGHYEIHSLRGAGGMGEVYRGRDVRLDRTVAIKVLPGLAASDADSLRRFEREGRAIAALSHPHICALYDIGEAPDPDALNPEPVRFLVMEYLEGDTLDDVLRSNTLPLDQVLRIAVEVADALNSAHRRGIVHRDLKPGNIMLTASGAKFVLYRSLDAKLNFDIWALSVADRRPFPVVQTPREERDAQFSPDGKWIAYQSNETGRNEIWVRPFPFPGSGVKTDVRWPVSANGGTQVRWGRDGTEIFYVALDGGLRAVPISVAAGGEAVVVGAPVRLFARPPLPFGGGTALPSYVVSRDGQRFLVSTKYLEPTSSPITVLLNWKPHQ